MNADVIDLIYQNEEVEGLAIFSREGNLVENQLSIDESSLAVVAKTIAEIATSLGEVNRLLKGFVLKSDKLTLMICVFDRSILLLELISPFSANKVEKNLRSLISGSTSLIEVEDAPAHSSPLEITEPVVANEPKKLLVNIPEVTPAVVEQQSENTINFSEYKSNMAKLMKRVAPGGVADKMIADVFAAESVDVNNEQIDRDLAIRLGEKIIAKIPNASRRKMIIKEYNVLSQKF